MNVSVVKVPEPAVEQMNATSSEQPSSVVNMLKTFVQQVCLIFQSHSVYNHCSINPIIFYFHLKNQTRYSAITYRLIEMVGCQKSKCSSSWPPITTFTCIVNIQTFIPAFTQTHSKPSALVSVACLISIHHSSDPASAPPEVITICPKISKANCVVAFLPHKFWLIKNFGYHLSLLCCENEIIDFTGIWLKCVSSKQNKAHVTWTYHSSKQTADRKSKRKPQIQTIP